MLGSNNIDKHIKNIAERDNVSISDVKRAITESFTEYYCKKENCAALLKIDFDEKENSSIFIYRVFANKEECPKKDREKIISCSNENGNEEYLLPLDLKSFPFEKMIDKITRRNKFNQMEGINHYKIGSLVKGVIKKVLNNEYCLIELENNFFGKCEIAELKNLREFRELGRRETWQSPNFLYFIVQEKSKESDYLKLTRWSNSFIEEIFRVNIPEIRRGEIIIKDILRIPGLFSKVILKEVRKGSVDPSGPCIGRGGDRIKLISKLVSPETIEVASWRDREKDEKEEKELLLNLLSPIKVSSLLKNREGTFIATIIDEKFFSNSSRFQEKIKLISKYMGKEILINSFEKNDPKKDKNTFTIWNGNMKLKSVPYFKK